MRKLFFIFCFLIMSPAVLAINFFYCNQTNSYIYPGDTLDQVKKLCGKPLSEKTETISIQREQPVFQFVYHFRPNTEERIYKPSALIINLLEEKIFSIYVEGVSVKETNYCSPTRPIKIGDPMRHIFYVCKKPSLKQMGTQQISEGEVEQTILTYQENEYQSPVKFYFHDNKLVKFE